MHVDAHVAALGRDRADGTDGFDYAGDNSPTVDDFDSSKDDSFFIKNEISSS